MNQSNIIDTERLESWLGYKGKRLEKCLQDNGIHYFYGKNGVCTTLDLINAAKGLNNTVQKLDDKVA